MVAQPQFDPTPVIRAMAIKGYKLDTLAAKANCSINAVWRITNNKSDRPRHLHKVCKVLGVKVEDCYPLPETTPSAPSARSGQAISGQAK